ncbi:ABC-type transport auxiliary lipoprotein family protein [Chromatiaceae bacterium AAb-1]|nr:ABC-type transport auxiliary lipoprotein family protein [Chromatiaceae bacterium AAb-1]
MKYLTPLLVISLLGCSSPQQSSYYQLPAVTGQQQEVKQAAHYLFVEQVQVANYLNGNGIVLQLSDVELSVARQHLWADALDKQLQRQLINRLELLLPDYQVGNLAQPGAYRVQVQVERFHGLPDGKAVISGRYNLPQLQQQYPFYFEIALAEKGYSGLVNALGQGWQKLAEQIAASIDTTS